MTCRTQIRKPEFGVEGGGANKFSPEENINAVDGFIWLDFVFGMFLSSARLSWLFSRTTCKGLMLVVCNSC